MIKCYYTANCIEHIEKPMLLYRNNPGSETHRTQKSEQLYVPLVKSWIELVEWFKTNYPEDEKIVRWAQHMTCVYAMEGIEALYHSGRSEEDVSLVLESYSCKHLLEDYKNVMLSQNRIDQIEEFYNNRRNYANKCRREGRLLHCKKWLKDNVPLVKNYYYKRKYPQLLDSKYVTEI